MGGVTKRHLVDGEWTSVTETAARLGIDRHQIYRQMSRRKCSLQTVVRMYRENMILHDDRGERHMVDGKWVTTHQMADMLGIKYRVLVRWKDKHPVDGRPGPLADAVDAARRGAIRHMGCKPVKHRVGNRMMTTIDAAQMLGISLNAVHKHMSRHHDSLEGTIRYYETRKMEQAEREIMAILNGE